jgi:hypothetical protein
VAATGEAPAVALGGGNKAQRWWALGGAGRTLKSGRYGAWQRRAHAGGGALWARHTSKAGRWRQGARWRQGGGGKTHAEGAWLGSANNKYGQRLTYSSIRWKGQ